MMAAIAKKGQYASNASRMRLEKILVYTFLTAGVFIMIVPLWWMIVSSLKTKGQFLGTQLSLAMPKNPQ